MPADTIALDNLRIAGQSVTFQGRHAVVWRYDGQGNLLAFAGLGCTGIQLDGHRFAWSEQPMDIAWHPLQSAHQIPGDAPRPLYRVWCGSLGKVRIPLDLDSADIQVWLGAHKPANPRQVSLTGTHVRVGYGARQVPRAVRNGRPSC